MGIVTDVTVPGEQFELGETLGQVDDTRVAFERVVPTGDSMFPYMWVYTDDHTRLCQLLQVDPAIESLRLVHHKGEKGLYDVEWSDETAGFLSCLRETNPIVLQAGGSATAWEFTLRFDCHAAISEFQQACTDRDISLAVDRVVNKSVADPPGQKLTGPQRETIELALERGYFDVPRKTTMVELADELGISDQAVSARIRRAMKKLSQHLVVPDSDTEAEPKNLQRP